jgi:hypothetical protein
LIDRMVDNLCHQSSVRVLTFGLDELEAREIKHRSGRVTRRVGDQFRQFPFEPTGVTHHPENEVLTTRPLRTGQLTGQRLKKCVDSLAALEPTGDQLRRCGPGR